MKFKDNSNQMEGIDSINWLLWIHSFFFTCIAHALNNENKNRVVEKGQAKEQIVLCLITDSLLSFLVAWDKAIGTMLTLDRTDLKAK